MEELSYNGNSIVVDCKRGAALMQWTCRKGQNLLPLIHHNKTYLFEGSWLFPFPNRVSGGRYQFQGSRYELATNDLDGLPNALHGLVHDQAFDIVRKEDNCLELAYCYEGDQPGFPFPYELRLCYQLKGEAELILSIEVVNLGEADMPCGLGWHPYFNLSMTPSARLKLPPVTQMEVDELMLPTGKERPFNDFKNFEWLHGHRFDTCFRLLKMEEKNSVFLSFPNQGTLELWQDFNFPFLQVYKTREDAIALEPMTCAIDALNNGIGLKVLSPRQSWRLQMGLRFF